jgi:hypothetical protein
MARLAWQTSRMGNLSPQQTFRRLSGSLERGVETDYKPGRVTAAALKLTKSYQAIRARAAGDVPVGGMHSTINHSTINESSLC